MARYYPPNPNILCDKCHGTNRVQGPNPYQFIGDTTLPCPGPHYYRLQDDEFRHLEAVVRVATQNAQEREAAGYVGTFTGDVHLGLKILSALAELKVYREKDVPRPV